MGKPQAYRVKEQVCSDFTQFVMGIVDISPSFQRVDSTLINSRIRKRNRNMLIFPVIGIAVRTMCPLSSEEGDLLAT